MTVGTSRGLIEQYFTGEATTHERMQKVFNNVWRFFYSMCGSAKPLELIALQFGTGGTADPGADPIAVPTFGQDAFFVVRYKKTGESGTLTKRTHSIYLLVQNANVGVGSGNGAPAVGIYGDQTSICFQTAIGVAGGILVGMDSNPWTGTTNKDGTDTKGATPKTGPVWNVVGGQVFVFPRSNNPGGAFNTDKQFMGVFMAEVYAYSVPPAFSRFHITSDDDCFQTAMTWSADDNYQVIVSGIVTPRTNITPIVPQWIYFAGTPNNEVDRSEGILARDGASSWRVMNFCNSILPWTQQPFQPNNQADVLPDYEDFPLVLRCNEYPYYGYIGIANTMRYCSNRTQMSLSTDKLTIHLGADQVLNNYRWLLPWDGVTAPGSGTTQWGIAFAI